MQAESETVEAHANWLAEQGDPDELYFTIGGDDEKMAEAEARCRDLKRPLEMNLTSKEEEEGYNQVQKRRAVVLSEYRATLGDESEEEAFLYESDSSAP